MGEFDEVVGLEDKLHDVAELNVTAKENISRLDELKNESKSRKKDVEESELGHKTGGKDISKLWDDSMEHICSVYRDGEQLTGSKKSIYDFLRDTKIINLYEREAKKHLNQARKNTNQLKLKADKVEKILYETRFGKKGIKVLLDEKTDIAITVANSLKKSKEYVNELDMEISKKKQEINTLRQKSADEGKSYNADINYLSDVIKKLEVSKREENRDYQLNKTKLKHYDKQIQLDSTIVQSLELVLYNARDAYSILEDQISYAENYVSRTKLIDDSIVGITINIDDVVDEGNKLVAVETDLVSTLGTTLERISHSVSQLKSNADKSSLVNAGSEKLNAYKQDSAMEIDDLTEKYATID